MPPNGIFYYYRGYFSSRISYSFEIHATSKLIEEKEKERKERRGIRKEKGIK